jgi:hypothetical protein
MQICLEAEQSGMVAAMCIEPCSVAEFSIVAISLQKQTQARLYLNLKGLATCYLHQKQSFLWVLKEMKKKSLRFSAIITGAS